MEVRAPAPMLPALPTPSPETAPAVPSGGPLAALSRLVSLLGRVVAPLGRRVQALAGFLRPCWSASLVPSTGAMATGPSDPPTAWGRSARPRPLAALLVFVLLLPLLQACSPSSQPPRAVLLDALALQIQLTQDQVAQALRVSPAGQPEVSRVRVEQQQPIVIGESRGLRLTGRFDWRLAEDPIRVDSPFELYLQRGARGQSWRLARPVTSADGVAQSWITDPLPLPGQKPGPGAVPASGSDAAG